MDVLIATGRHVTNPYIQLLESAYQRAGCVVRRGDREFFEGQQAPGIVHLHWPEALYRWENPLPLEEATVDLIGRRLDWYASQGCMVVYTVHNLQPHEAGRHDIEERIYAQILDKAALVLHHGKASYEDVLRSHPGCASGRHLVVPHGYYPAQHAPRCDSRRHYGLPAGRIVLLNFGFQRDYKGADFAYRVAAGLGEQFHLFTIGQRLPRNANLLARNVARARNALVNRFGALYYRRRGRTTVWRKVSDDEVGAVMAATDIVLLGHQSGLNSGVLALAASYSCPVVYPTLGNFADQVALWPWAEPYSPADVASARSAILALTNRLEAKGAELDNSAWLAAHGWDQQIEAILEFLHAGADR